MSPIIFGLHFAFLIFNFTFLIIGTLYSSSTVYEIQITVLEKKIVSLTILNSSVYLDSVVKGSSVTSNVTQRTIVKNTGDTNIDLKLKISSSPAGWTPGNSSLSDTTTNQYVLGTVFHVWNSTPAWSDYSVNDIITTTDKVASNTVFKDDAESFQQNVHGYNIAPNGEVSNFYFFNSPTELSNSSQYGNPQSIVITVTAVQSE